MPFDHVSADVVIIGAGSAGCVLANRLSVNPKRRVLLLEAGPPDRHPWLKIPAGFTQTFFHDVLNWGFFTEPESDLDGRRIYWPRGRTLGGSSAINAMVYMRGHARDYDDWAAAGNPGWSWRDVLPRFVRGERALFEASGAHGCSGELNVSLADFVHPATRVFLDAARATGLSANGDFNDGETEGAGLLHYTIGGGLRASAASAFLDARVRSRPNLRIVTNAHAVRILLDGRQAIGVQCRRGAATFEVRAREVVLSAGAIGSPQLLLLSGIGSPEELRAVGVAPLHALPGVGRNLQDHIYISASAPSHRGLSMNARLRGVGLAAEALRYALTRRGALALGASQASVFARSWPGADRPDLQINFTPLSFSFSAQNRIRVDPKPGITLALAHLRPSARGAVRLAAPDALAPPLINANYLERAEDVRAVLAGIRLMQRIAAASPLKDGLAAPLFGARDISDEALMAIVRREAGSLFHPVGTCGMGAGADAVVDARLRVHGIAGLRVVDASIMPTIVSGNTNAPAMMIGEMGADFIAQDEAD